ncbi:MAG: hypothetical protein J6331_08700, partial [Lentisphaeria bacterium]|nr:hypothetical protein [Lentisphaeria bacterium]
TGLLILLPSDMYASIAGAPIPLPAWMGTIAKIMALASELDINAFILAAQNPREEKTLFKD